MQKLPLLADSLLTLWVSVVAVLYFGGWFFPRIGAWTGPGAAVYGLMVLVSALILASRYLRR